jgi:hypothetical protein
MDHPLEAGGCARQGLLECALGLDGRVEPVGLQAEQERKVDAARRQASGEGHQIADLGGAGHIVGPVRVLVRPVLLHHGEAGRQQGDDE